MNGEESLAQVNRWIASPKLKNLKRARLLIFVYCMVFTSLVYFSAAMRIPDNGVRRAISTISSADWPAFLGVALVGASAWLCYKVFAVNATTAGLVFLVEILLFATGWGLFEALSAAVAAVLLLNYLFLPPVGHFTIADPQNWVALFAFLITAIVASQLSATIRKQAREAVKRREEMERPYSFSRSILRTESDQPIGAQLAVQAARILESTGIAIFDAQNNKTHLGGLWDTGPRKSGSGRR